MAVAVKHLSADGAAEITSKSWSDIIAGTSNTPLKFFVWNVGDRDLTNFVFDVVQVGTGDGYNYVKWAADTVTLSCPWGFTATVVGSGGSIPSGTTYYYKITGTNAAGETTGSLEVSGTTTVASSSITLAWTALPSANTTGGASPAYGTPPTLGTSAITIGTLAKGRQWIYWVGLVVGASVTESGNPRYAQRRFREA